MNEQYRYKKRWCTFQFAFLFLTQWNGVLSFNKHVKQIYSFLQTLFNVQIVLLTVNMIKIHVRYMCMYKLCGVMSATTGVLTSYTHK